MNEWICSQDWLGLACPFWLFSYCPIPTPIISLVKTSCAWAGEKGPHNEPAPTSTPWRMNGEWWGNNFLLGPSSLANHGD
jgi:hypothetical protein